MEVNLMTIHPTVISVRTTGVDLLTDIAITSAVPPAWVKLNKCVRVLRF